MSSTYEISFDYSPDPLTGWKSKQIEQMRAKAQKLYLASIKAQCERCHKAGKNCRNTESCNARRLKAALRGFDHKALQGLTLASPPDDWKIARGYGYMSDQYLSGGYVRRNSYASFKLRHGVDPIAMREHYAYDLAMGVSWSDEAELAA